MKLSLLPINYAGWIANGRINYIVPAHHKMKSPIEQCYGGISQMRVYTPYSSWIFIKQKTFFSFDALQLCAHACFFLYNPCEKPCKIILFDIEEIDIGVTFTMTFGIFIFTLNDNCGLVILEFNSESVTTFIRYT